MTTTMSNKLVERRLNDFKRRCGEYGDAALQLAYHAAMPVALNPELLHFLRINFFLDPPEQLPYTVEFEFLTSGLCREIDAELYEIEPEIRNILLQGLMKREDAPQRIRDVATLLWQYVKYHSPWTDRVELERAQQLTALNFLNPVKAQKWLDEAKANPSQVGRAEWEWFVAMRQEIKQLPDLKPVEPPIDNPSQFDVFLAHNSQDKDLVREIGNRLKERNLTPWLDEEQIPPGRSFQDEIQKAIPVVKSAAIFLGLKGLGKWQQMELRSFILQCVERNIPVIPVLLPGVNKVPENLVFLKEYRWINFERIDDENALSNLVWGITRANALKFTKEQEF